MKGGKVIGSGTYGCVFKPPLKCEDQDKRPENYISKVMLTRNARDENREIMGILDLVKDIPNHEDYFMVSGVKLCKPKLPEIRDYDDYNKKCSALLRKKINSWDFPKALRDGNIMMLQIPDGGASIDDLFGEQISEANFSLINNALIDLMVNGIVPLNSFTNTLHMDVKGGNIVYSKRENKAKLIDWGLAIHFKNRKIAPINDLEQYSIMVNQPFTRLLFYSNFQRELNRFSKSYAVTRLDNNNYDTLMPVYTKYLRDNFLSNSQKKRNDVFTHFFGDIGHLDYILYMMHRLFGEPKKGLDIISQQLASAYLRFSFKGGIHHNFDENAFFYEVFRHNCDIHGLLYAYHDATMSKTKLSSSLRKEISKMLIKFPFSNEYAAKKFNIIELTTVLHSLSKIKVHKPAVTAPKAPKQTVKRKATPFIKIEKGPSDRAVADLLTLESTRKRCPKGSRRDKKTGKCKKIEKGARTAATRATKADVLTLSPTRKRCPRGYRIDKKTRKCHRIRK